MKTLLLGSLLLGAALAVPVLAAPPALPVVKAGPKAVAAPAESKIIDFAQQRGLDVLIDSTRIDPEAPLDPLIPEARGPMQEIGNVFGVYADEHHLSEEQLGADTYLFWAEPDQDQLAAAVARGEGFGVERGLATPQAVVLAVRQALDPQGTTAELAALQEAANRPYDPRQTIADMEKRLEAAPPKLETKLSQLPPELQSSVVALVVQLTLNDIQNASRYHEIWAHDEVWQRARIRFRAAGRVVDTPATLFVQVAAENARNRVLLTLFPFDGSGHSDLSDLTETPANGAALGEAQLRILPVNPAQEAATIATTPLVASGSSLQTLQNTVAESFDFGAEPALQNVVSASLTRRPLAELLSLAAKAAGVKMSVSPDLQGVPPLISARVDAMPVSQLMQAVAHLYGARWVKAEDGSFTLSKGALSPFALELRRIGNFDGYRSRNNLLPYHQLLRQQWNQMAATVFDDAGQTLTQPEGVAFSSLTPEIQQEIRGFAAASVPQFVLREQAKVRDLLKGDWSMAFNGRTSPDRRQTNSPWAESNIILSIDGKFARNIKVPTPPPLARIKVASPRPPQ